MGSTAVSAATTSRRPKATPSTSSSRPPVTTSRPQLTEGIVVPDRDRVPHERASPRSLKSGFFTLD
jgi:hypothetical protein